MKWVNFGDKSRLAMSMVAGRLINAFRNPANLTFRRILCIKTDEIGDMCYSTHVFRMLRMQFPYAEIAVLCKAYSRPVIANDKGINNIYTSWEELKGNYDLIVDLQVSWKSIFFALRQWPLARLDRGTVRISDAARGQYPHEVVTNARVVESVIRSELRTIQPQILLSDADRAAAAGFIAANRLEKFAVFHIGARRALRKWPVAGFTAMAEYIYQKGGMKVVFTGSPDESVEIEQVRAMTSVPSANTAGQLSLTELAALFEKASLYIGNESGPLHIAALMGVPCVGLFGPGPATIFYPYGKKTAVLHHVLPCNPCDQIHCVFPDNPCIARITVEEVKNKVDELLS